MTIININLIRAVISIVILISSSVVYAQAPVTTDNTTKDFNQKVQEACVANEALSAPPDKTIGEIKKECQDYGEGLVDYRIILEKQVANNPFAILPHRQNYILPISYSEPHEDIYDFQLNGRSLDDVEAEFQLSIKFVAAEDVFMDGMNVEFGFTTISWWQTYNGNISAPFRETNYEPELIFSYSKSWSLFGLDVKHSFLSLNHQSNGKAGVLSRSWNRIIGGLAFQHNNLVWSGEVWWRIPEDGKDSPTDLTGDDNPNIERFIGQGQFGVLWKSSKDHNLQLLLRNNFRNDNRGSVKMGWSFPFSKRLRGYVQFFNGYGESLVSYDRHSSRLGIGIMLTDWL